jgi:zinc transporter 2
MTSITTFCHREQSNKNNINDENTSNDSLLLMADTFEDRVPLLNINDDDPVLSNDIPLRSRSLTIHCHVPDEKFDYAARNRLLAVLVLCIGFMIIEIIGGILSNSTAVITDAAHMCIDGVSFMVSLAAIYLAKKRPTQKLSFGYIRAEVLGALVSVLMIWVATGILVYMAIERCIHQSFEVKPTEMIIVASCGVLFNIVMFFVLHANTCGNSISHHGHSHRGNHGHSHNDDVLVVDNTSRHNHEDVVKQTISLNNINVQAAIIHVIGDFVQSVGVLLAAILIKIKPECKLADPICTFVFSVLVMITTITIMRDIIRVLMEGVPSNVNYKKILDDLLRLPGVRNAHSLHIWSLSLQKIALSVHIAIDVDQDYLTVLNDAQEMLRREHTITRVTIQIEPYDEQIMNSCETCRRPEI